MPPEKGKQKGKVAVVSVDSGEAKKQIRLGFGIFFIVLGTYVCLSLVSYFFTWQTDQDKFFSATSIPNYLFHNRIPVANWGGRTGAALAHILVYRGAGVASLALGLSILALGLHLVYTSRKLPLLRYLRWLSIALLIGAPAVAYLFPNTEVRYGGAMGNESVSYLNGLLGSMGTGMFLLGATCFFLFAILALDISPAWHRMRRRAHIKAEAAMEKARIARAQRRIDEEEALAAAQQVKEEAEAARKKPSAVNAETTPAPFSIKSKNKDDLEIQDDLQKHKPSLNGLRENSSESTESPEAKGVVITPVKKPVELQIIERRPIAEPAAVKELPNHDLDADIDEIDDEEQGLSTPSAHSPDPIVQAAPLSFEVFTQNEEPAIKHGAHISIASNEPYAPELDLPDYKFPTLDLMEDRGQQATALDREELTRNKEQIETTLKSFGIEIKSIAATVGPTVTLYEIVPAEGVRISKIRNLEDDIALNLAALGIRIIAPIPGRGTIGIEVPNANKQLVPMRTLLASDKFVNAKMSLPIALGKKIDNENYIVDLATMPHLLMAGATGQGKSVGINAILLSLLYKKHPSQVKFVLIDPKKVELSIYRLIEKHFLAKLPDEEEPIITDTKKAIYTLKALCDEMDSRYEMLKDAGARNIKEYNDKIIARRIKNPAEHKYLPFIVLVIDEFADLIMTAGKEVEMPIARLAQLARAVGIHIIIATQRPSVNVITGIIKANFPARIAFKVSAKVDSRTILDTGGAEQLIGRGDMLVSHGSELLRLQCAFVDTPEVENVVEFIAKQRGYNSAHLLPEPEISEADSASKSFDAKNKDKLFEECARIVVQQQSGSTSMLQRRFNLGYNRAGRIMDQLEAAGIVGPAVGSKPRDVLFHSEHELDELLGTI